MNSGSSKYEVTEKQNFKSLSLYTVWDTVSNFDEEKFRVLQNKVLRTIQTHAIQGSGDNDTMCTKDQTQLKP